MNPNDITKIYGNIQAMVQKEARDIAQKVFDENAAKASYTLPDVPYHVHQGTDSPSVNYGTLTGRKMWITKDFEGTSLFDAPSLANTFPATLFTAPIDCALNSVQAIYNQAGTTGTINLYTFDINHFGGSVLLQQINITNVSLNGVPQVFNFNSNLADLLGRKTSKLYKDETYLYLDVSGLVDFTNLVDFCVQLEIIF